MKLRSAVLCTLLIAVLAVLPVVARATAKFAKGEAIAVTVDHDADEHLALVIRLGAAK